MTKDMWTQNFIEYDDLAPPSLEGFLHLFPLNVNIITVMRSLASACLEYDMDLLQVCTSGKRRSGRSVKKTDMHEIQETCSTVRIRAFVP